MLLPFLFLLLSWVTGKGVLRVRLLQLCFSLRTLLPPEGLVGLEVVCLGVDEIATKCQTDPIVFWTLGTHRFKQRP